VVQPDAFEHELEQLALGFRIFFPTPKDREVVELLHKVLLDDLGPDQRLVAALAVAPSGAEVARFELAPDGPLHLRLAPLAAGEPAQQIAGRRAAGLERARPRAAEVLDTVERLLTDDRLV
jgi:hypothetical protein